MKREQTHRLGTYSGIPHLTGRTLFSTNESLDNIPVCRSLDHTMSIALDQYVCQKLPIQELLEATALGIPIELHGLTPGYLENAPREFCISSFSRIPWEYVSTVKESNNIRPTFYKVMRESEQSIFVIVPFGQDYIRHYATLIRHFISMNTVNHQDHISVTRYPRIEVEMADITGLNSLVVQGGDIVVIGHVSELRDFFRKRYESTERFFRNSYYTSQRIRCDKNMVNFLGVKYSYWGSISKGLVNRLCELGASQIIYSAKLGTLGSENEIYNRIFSPSSYFVFDHLLLKMAIKDFHNPFLDHFNEYDSGAHASVPTVLEETFAQREYLEKFKIQTIDNEISQMAEAIVQYNNMNGTFIPFFALHFATDFLRRNNEKLAWVSHDLSRNRTEEATQKKQLVLGKIATLLADYLEAT